MAAAKQKSTGWTRIARVVTWVIVGPLLMGLAVVSLGAVSYTHLTLPTILRV